MPQTRHATHDLEEMTASRGIDYNAHARFLEENCRPYIWLAKEQYYISAMKQFQRKPNKFFGPPLPYVTAFSERTDAPEVICDLTPTTVTLLCMHVERELFHLPLKENTSPLKPLNLEKRT